MSLLCNRGQPGVHGLVLHQCMSVSHSLLVMSGVLWVGRRDLAVQVLGELGLSLCLRDLTLEHSHLLLLLQVHHHLRSGTRHRAAHAILHSWHNCPRCFVNHLAQLVLVILAGHYGAELFEHHPDTNRCRGWLLCHVILQCLDCSGGRGIVRHIVSQPTETLITSTSINGCHIIAFHWHASANFVID